MKKSSFYACALVCLFACFPLKCEGAGLLFRLFGAEAKICVTVVDDDGKPVEGAVFFAGFRQYNHGICHNLEVLTDSKGYAELSAGCDEFTPGIEITKDGYYPTDENDFTKSDFPKGKKVEDGKWQPYGVKKTYVLKKIRKPVPMVVFWNFYLHAPELGKDFGYDLEYGSFVEPYGDGKIADFFVKYEWDENDQRTIKKVTVSFPNELDGAYISPLYRPSKLWSPHQADADAKYEKEFVFYTIWNKDTKGNEFKVIEEKGIDENHELIMRTRTKVDDTGKIVCAYYSKWYGDIEVCGATPKKIAVGDMTTYFNPVANDTNLECDGKWHRELRKGKRENEACGPCGAL